ncbi:hypothetical protein SDC9_129562 [bioreactor metagenome]|uniref:Uncharacterized protein n=1 Tax=bioreactor metagenome TaxID=1076179 RepID=A0A645D053_9ZZZZ
MWLETFDFVTFVSVVLCAAAIKMADDFLDYDQDKAVGSNNLTVVLGKGLPIYAMLMLGLAINLNPPLCLALFLASYGIGMFHDLKSCFPSKLTGLQECVISLLLGIGLCGWKHMIFAFTFMLAIQLIDDCIDARTDQLSGYRNFAHCFGCVESYMLAVLSLLISWRVGESLFLPVLSAAIIFYVSLVWFQRGRKYA